MLTGEVRAAMYGHRETEWSAILCDDTDAPVRPLWKNVESPTTPKIFLSETPCIWNAFDMPIPSEKPPPIQAQVSIAESGAAYPSV